ncbi:MAG: hypothetical protein M3R13_12040, partial [Armatimonadota bacterium]|nr:hypothetical protein [Armatimonadota bacterium]
MANSNLTVDMVTREALRIAHEKATFTGTIDRSYDDSFAKTGAKIGSTLRVRKPNQYTVRTSGRVMDVQDQLEASTTITVATQYGVDMRFHSSELALEIDDFSKRYIEPAVSVLASRIDAECLSLATKATYSNAGTAGTVVGASADITALFDARARLNQYLAPKADRSIQVDSVTMASIVNGAKALFHDGGQVKEAFREGFYARTAMADFYENERTYAHTTGSDHTTVTVNDTSIASGDAALTTAGGNVKAGTVFTIADVFSVHPETKVSTGRLMQFVTLADATTAWTFSPAYHSTGAQQNVNALPVTGAAIVLVGSASTAYRNNLMYHKEAFTFVT